MTQPIVVDLRNTQNKTTLSTKYSDWEIKQNTSLQIGKESAKKNSIGETIEQLDDDVNGTLVIAPLNNNISVRNSTAIRASLKPLLNQERINQSTQFMQDFKTMQ